MSEEAISILTVDDDDNFRNSLNATLQQHDYSVQTATSGGEALDKFSTGEFDIVLVDFKMPDIDGIDFIKKWLQRSSGSAIVLMTAFGDQKLAGQALRQGAYDYISKPFSPEDLILTLKKVEERLRLKQENLTLKNVINKRYSFSNIIAESESMREIFETVKRLASYNTTVLITGESGTGKELLARAIHHNSPRRGKPFVAVNCGAIPENLIEAELFGFKRGAFTDATRDRKGLFEEANGGTIFLDEIGELPLHLQVKLLRTLQEQQIRPVGEERSIHVDIRVIAATHKDLEEEVFRGKFRDDLFFRLNVVSIEIPPLRDRPEDIPVLVDHFISKLNQKLGLHVKGIEPEAMKLLMNYRWRGNIRELENCMERALVLTDTAMIGPDTLPETLREPAPNGSVQMFEGIEDDNLSIKQRTRSLEVNLITRALRQTNGNRTRAAKLLEISHRALLYKLKEYGIS